MKRKLLIVLTLVLVLAVPFSVFAATSDTPAAKSVRGFFRLNFSKLTDQQKSDVKDYNQKLADLQKDFINKMVANGAMTKEQGDAEIERIDDMLKRGGENGLMPGFGMGGKRFGGRGMKDNFGFGKIDTSKLTDQQKTDLNKTYKKMSDLQKELINKLVSDSLLTKEQGDAAIKKLDDMAKLMEQSGSSKVPGMGMGGFSSFNFFGANKIDDSKLTDQQKADLTDYFKKMAELQKESISKMVAFGLITKDQGDNAIQRIGDMEKFREENGFTGGMRMGKGHFGNRARFRSPDTGISNAPAM